MSNISTRLFTILALFCISNRLLSLTYALQGDDVVGNVIITQVQADESLGDIGRRYSVGVYEMIEANRQLDAWLPPEGADVLIPTQFILPPGPREDLVLNLAEMRIYFYPRDGKTVSTYPVGIGRREWPTPLGLTTITQKTNKPTWRPPESIRAEHALAGDILPAVVHPGPDNPLGDYAMRLAIPSFLLHSTNQPGGVGLRSSHGCIRMLPEDIAELFPQVSVGTKVRIIHAPYKLGWFGDILFLEAHEPLKESRFEAMNGTLYLVQAVESFDLRENQLDWLHANAIAEEAIGIPLPVDIAQVPEAYPLREG